MSTLTDQQLLRDYTGSRSEPAFAELVKRHIDLVHSAALRMVRDAHLAKDVTQGVFLALAKNATLLAEHPVLSGWLHLTTRNLAVQTVRTDSRRRAREQEAAAMNELLANEPDASWEEIAPRLDAALAELSESDRDALLLRYFERKSAQEMSGLLGISDEAAQKRVTRAVERLREVFAKQGVTVGAGGLVVVISANAVQAAPIGLAAAVTEFAALAGLAATSTTIAAVTKTILMTTLQKTLVTITLTAAIGAGIYEAMQASTLREQVRVLQQKQAPLADEIKQLQVERDTASNKVASLTDELAHTKKAPSELLKLRGEVGHLRQENATIGESSAISKLTASPEARKFLREQQKAGMTIIYKDFVTKLNLPKDRTEKFNDTLADGIMDGIDRITESLHDKKTQAQIDQVFTQHEAALQQKLQEVIGPDGITQYQEYSRNLLANITADQFFATLTSDKDTKEVKEDKKKQFAAILQEETQSAVTGAGLPADYQAVPMLNFRNIASETAGEQSMKMMDDIYNKATARSSNLLSAEELASFAEFRAKARSNNKAALSMNRTLMAPLMK